MFRRQFNKMMGLSPLLMSFPNTIDMENKTCKSGIVKPKALKKGDTVALIAPGSPIKPEKIENAIQNIKNMDLIPIYTDTVFRKYGYLAGSDKERLDDFHNAIANKDIKAVWCLRGGYGCTRLLDNINYNLIKKNPKVIIGYSDITALLLAIQRNTGLVGFHGPVAISQIFTSYTSSQVETMLFGKLKEPYIIPYQTQSEDKYALGHETFTISSGIAKGILTGGNLSLLVNLPGTKFAPSYKNKIVFIEDVGEKPYRIDRMLTYLIQATDLKKAAGIVLGVFNDCESKDSDESLSLKQTLTDRLLSLGMPCFYGFTFGHVADICTFPIGIEAIMDADNFSVNLTDLPVDVA